MYFDELDLSDNILDALWDMHFEVCTPVQEECIPQVLNHRDVLGIAQTGTGKTAAYLLPILSLLDGGDYPEDAINCVVMAPTRELAQQIDQAMQGFSYYLPRTNSLAVYGGNDGVRFEQEHRAMKTGADMLIATPGRLISHKQLGNLDLSRCSFFVLDEADCMLDMGFYDDIMTIASDLPKSCQILMFSATMPSKIETLARTLLKEPAMVKIAVSKPVEKVRQSAYVCYELQKPKLVHHIFTQGDLRRVLLFCGKKMKVKEVTRELLRMKINCGEMHSDLSQEQRNEMMFRFKSGQIDVLVATDILARGIDIDDIAMVINYDVPHEVEDYIHRIGRTARAEKDGIAITFVNPDDIYYFKRVEEFLGRTIDKNALPEGIGETPPYEIPRHSDSRRGQRQHSRRQQTQHTTPPRKQHPAAKEQDAAAKERSSAAAKKRHAHHRRQSKKKPQE